MMTIHYSNKSELLAKLEAIKADIAEADQNYQHAFARVDFNECGTHRNTLSLHRRVFGAHKKYQIKKGWL